MNVECRDVSECIINGVASVRELYDHCLNAEFRMLASV